MNDFAAESFCQVNLTDSESSIFFDIIDPSEEILEWLKENPSDYYFKGMYSHTSTMIYILCSWKDKKKAMLFKLLFSNKSKHNEEIIYYNEDNIARFFNIVLDDYLTDKENYHTIESRL